MKHDPAHRGFTLIELVMVTAIISLLASIILVNLDNVRKNARDAQRSSDMHQIRNALELYYEEHGNYPGNADAGVSNSGEQIGDDSGPIEQALSEFMASVPRDPQHDGSVYFYSYDPQHCTDSAHGECDCAGPTGAVLALNKQEGDNFNFSKDTCSGGDQNQHNADYNVVMFPAPE